MTDIEPRLRSVAKRITLTSDVADICNEGAETIRLLREQVASAKAFIDAQEAGDPEAWLKAGEFRAALIALPVVKGAAK